MRISHLKSYNELTLSEKKTMSLRNIVNGITIARQSGLKSLPKYFSDHEKKIIKEAWFDEWGMELQTNN